MQSVKPYIEKWGSLFPEFQPFSFFSPVLIADQVVEMSVGLALGDFCGVVAVAREDGGEEVVANADGERYTPSAVGFGEEGVVVSLVLVRAFSHGWRPVLAGAWRPVNKTARAQARGKQPQWPSRKSESVEDRKAHEKSQPSVLATFTM